MAEASDFKFGTQLGFAKAHYKTTARGKVGAPWVREAPIYLGFPFNISPTVLLALAELLVEGLLMLTTEVKRTIFFIFLSNLMGGHHIDSIPVVQ